MSRLTARSLWIALLLAALVSGAVVLRVGAAPSTDDGCDPFTADGAPVPPKDCECDNVDITNPRYCMSGFESIGYILSDLARSGLRSAARGIAMFFWLLMRMAVIVCDALLRGELWVTIRETILGQLAIIFGGEDGVLYRLVVGSQGNPGLLSLAVMLAGLLLTFPFLASGSTRLVKIDRVIVWGILLMALFIGSTQGIDLIGQVESLRVSMMLAISGAGEGTDGTDTLLAMVATPMLATTDEVRSLTEENRWSLPERFEGEMFPEIEKAPRRVIVFDSPSLGGIGDQLDLIFRIDVMDDASYERSMGQTGAAIVMILLSLFPLCILIGLALGSVTLEAASLALIIFLLAALPLGFFEPGAMLLVGIGRQYTAVVALSFLMGVLVQIMSATTLVTWIGGFTLADLGTYLGMQILIAILVGLALKASRDVFDGSLGVLRQSVVMASALAYSTEGPLGAAAAAGKGLASTAVTAAAGAAVGFATGGVVGAVMGGAGGLLSKSKAGGQVASLMTSLSPDDLDTQRFSAAVHSGGSALRATTGLIAVARRSGSHNHSAFPAPDGQPEKTAATTSYQPARLNPKWQAVEMDGSITADLAELEEAEKAYFAEMDVPEARRHLLEVYGSSAISDEVLGLYGEQGAEGAEWVRGVTETAQAAAIALHKDGIPLFDDRGRHSAAYRAAVDEALRANSLDTGDTRRDSLARRLAGAVVRKPCDLWETGEQAPRLLARDTLEPERTEVQVGDISAQYALRDLAVRQGWDKPENAPRLEAVFHAYQAASLTTPVSQIGSQQVYELLCREAALANERPEALREAARLVVLVGNPAEIQHGPEEPEHIVNVRQDEAGLSFSAPYSEQLNRRIFDEIPSGSRMWDEEDDRWQVEAEYAGTAQEIVAGVAAEHGWAVQYTDDLPDDIRIQETENKTPISHPTAPVPAETPKVSSIPPARPLPRTDSPASAELPPAVDVPEATPAPEPRKPQAAPPVPPAPLPSAANPAIARRSTKEG